MDDRPDMLRKVLVSLVLLSIIVFAITFILKSRVPASVDIELPSFETYDNSFTLSTIISGTHNGFTGDVTGSNMTLNFNEGGNLIFVNDDTLRIKESGEVELQLIGYTGTVNFKETLTFDGTVISIVVNGVELSPAAQVNVRSEGLAINSLNIDKIAINKIELIGSGTLESDKVTYTAASENIILKGYVGMFSQQGDIGLNGVTSVIEVESDTSFSLR